MIDDSNNDEFLISQLIRNDQNFYKNNPSDKIWWIKTPGVIGLYLFTFNRKKIYNLYKDYPNSLNEQEKEIFDKENPYWSEYFKSRK